MGSDGRHTIPREEFVPGSQQLGEMGVRTLHTVVRITATKGLASSRGRFGGKHSRGELAAGLALTATMYRMP